MQAEVVVVQAVQEKLEFNKILSTRLLLLQVAIATSLSTSVVVMEVRDILAT
jgi:hypothetical protein